MRFRYDNVITDKHIRKKCMRQKSMTQKFEPKIIAFLCKWCASSAADLAGTSRIQYPPNVIIIRLMCSGSIDPVYVIKALFEGADGVLIGGCHPGDCHYISGNYKARRRMVMLKSILKNLGLDERRVRVEWIGANEGRKFADVATQITEEIKKLGPNPMGHYWSI